MMEEMAKCQTFGDLVEKRKSCMPPSSSTLFVVLFFSAVGSSFQLDIHFSKSLVSQVLISGPIDISLHFSSRMISQLLHSFCQFISPRMISKLLHCFSQFISLFLFYP